MKCGYSSCISSFSAMDDELVSCIWILFISGFIYIFVGIYLYEVIPQQFGVRRHPLFCIKRFIKVCKTKKNKVKNDTDGTQEITNMMNSHDIEMDDEIKNEVQQIKEIGVNKKDFPLIVDGMTKVNKKKYF